MQSKFQIRSIILEKRKKLSDDFVLKKSLKIIEKLKKIREFKEAKNIWIFYPLKWEVDLLALLDLKDKDFYFPKVDWEDMHFWLVKNFSELMEWRFWIFEPITYNDISLDLIIVPWLAFSLTWKRIGFWKWYYDRFLDSLSDKPKLIWVCFDFQVFEDLAQDGGDVLVDKLIFE